ncbi:MAG: SMI1/KNR4 family protein [Sterolibacteriaceae bacterium]|nr:SMI1/KNR4 family protein [Candidatus Methylophosphatis haderslevensis]
MGIPIQPTFIKPSASDVGRFARSIGVSLPPDYVNFLIEFGGGSPEGNIYRSDSRVSVSRFCGIDGIQGSIQQLSASYKGRIPERAIPIAEAAGGNLVLLRLPQGSVCFWDHEREAFDKTQPTGNEACTELASSFSEFIDNLVPMPSEPTNDAHVISTKIDPAFAAKFGLKQGNK